MALRGSLHEFELAEIFQLISRDGKTGQLVLSHQDSEAFVIFSQGSIVAAGNSDQNLQTFIFRYLMSVKRYTEDELNELLYVCQGEMRLFSLELVNRNYLSNEELFSLAQTGIEDLACSLFLWEDGNYRFDALDSIHEYTIAGVSFPVDAVTMEAMRRSDEWKRIKQHIRRETVFSPLQKSPRPSTLVSPLTDPSGYIQSFIDGVSSVGAICEKSILIPYRVYEILFGLWQNSVIAPLSVKHPQTQETVKAPGRPAAEISAAIATIAGILLWIFVFYTVTRVGANFLLKDSLAVQQKALSEIDEAYAMQKARIASLQYRAEKGQSAPKVKDLLPESFVTKKDITHDILKNFVSP